MSKIPNSINVGQQIAPNYTDDTFALFDPIYGIGGLREVASLTERNNISAERLRIGMLVYVTSENKFYRLVSFSENQNPPYDIITNWENVIFLNNSEQTISGTKTFASRPNVNGTGFVLSGETLTLPTTVAYTTGDQTLSGTKTFASRPNVNGTGFLLSGEVLTLPTTIVYTTGAQTLSGTKTFASRPNVNGTGFVLSGETLTLPTTVAYTTGDQTLSGTKTFASRPNVNGTGFLLNGEVIGLINGIQTFSGAKTFNVRPNVNGTGFLLSGEVLTLPTTIVYTTGAQTLSGNKTFSNQIVFGNENGRGGFISGSTNGGDSSLVINADGPEAKYIYLNASPASMRLGEDGIHFNAGNEDLSINGADSVLIYGNGDVYAPNMSAYFKNANINNLLNITDTGNYQVGYISGYTQENGEVTRLYITANGGLEKNLILSAEGQSLTIGRDGGLNYGNNTFVINGNGEDLTIQNADVYVQRNAYASNLVYNVGDQIISGNKTFLDNILINNLTVTGTRTIANTEENNIDSNYLLLNITGGITNGGIYFVTGAGFSGVNSSGPIIAYDANINKFRIGTGIRSTNINSLKTIAAVEDVVTLAGNQTISGVKSFSDQIKFLREGAAYPFNPTISGGASIDNEPTLDIDAFKLNLRAGYNKSEYIELGGEEGRLNINTVADTSTFNLGTVHNASSNLSYNISSPSINLYGQVNGQTGTFQKLYADNLVYNTGNQTVSGFKNFPDGITSITEDGYPASTTLGYGGITIFNGDGNNTVLDNGSLRCQTEAFTIKTEDYDPLYLGTNNQNRLTITPDGNIGIGTDDPSEKLEVVGNIKADNLVYNVGDQIISGNKNFTNGLNINNNPLFYSQPSGFFSGVAVTGSGDGGYFIGKTKISQNTLILKDESFGKNHVTKQSIRNWQSVAISADGKYQTAVTNIAGSIYISNDYGDTWQEKGPVLSWFRIAMSSCGKYQTASTYNSPFGDLYISDNYGHTWTQILTNVTSIQKIAMSSDGKIQIFVRYTTSEYSISRDYGKTWTNGTVNSTSGVKGVAISSDGKYITIVGAGSMDRIYTSSNYGLNWTTIGSIGTWNSVTMSADGKFQAAVAGGTGYVYISNDYGNTWTRKNNAGSRPWLSISMSSDGKYIAATTNGTYNYVSYDYGENWIVSYINNRIGGSYYTCNDIAVSSNGKYILTAAQGQYIYVSKTEEKVDGNLYTDNVYGNNLVYRSSNQTISGVKTFADRPTVNGTGILLSGEMILPSNIVYTTGYQIISGMKSFNDQLNAINGFTSQSVSYFNNTVILGEQDTFNNIDVILYDANNNEYYQKINAVEHLFNLQSFNGQTGFAIDITGGEIFHYNSGYQNKISNIYFKSGAIDLNNNNLINARNLVYNTGNQTISGEKTFKTRPTVNGSGVFLIGDSLANLPSSSDTINVKTGNFYQLNTDNLVVSGTATFNNINLSEIDSVYVSGADVVIDYSGNDFFKITPTGILSNLPIVFGNNNVNSGASSNSIFGGYFNTIGRTNRDSFIIHAGANSITSNSGSWNTINGGKNNDITSGSNNYIFGGLANEIKGENSYIMGGEFNFISGSFQKLFTYGGTAIGDYSSLIGGTFNTIHGGQQNLILGGNYNDIFTSATTGINTIINSWRSAIQESSKTNLIINGAYNNASGDYNSIINGFYNKNYGRYNNVLNGYDNTISGAYSTIINGKNNILNGSSSTVLCGSDNTISKDGSAVIGNKNYIDHSGAVLISDSTSRGKYSKDTNSLSIDFANGVYLENQVSIYDLRLRNKKYTDYSYRSSDFVFSTYMNIVNSTSPVNAILTFVEDTKNFFVKNINSGVLNITSNYLIDGQPSITLYKNESAEFMGIMRNDYTGWVIIGGNQGIN